MSIFMAKLEKKNGRYTYSGQVCVCWGGGGGACIRMEIYLFRPGVCVLGEGGGRGVRGGHA